MANITKESRLVKSKKRFLDLIWKNGGNWVRIEHSNGHAYHVARHGATSYERIEQDSFRVEEVVNGEELSILRSATLDEVAEFLLDPSQRDKSLEVEKNELWLELRKEFNRNKKGWVEYLRKGKVYTIATPSVYSRNSFNMWKFDLSVQNDQGRNTLLLRDVSVNTLIKYLCDI